MATIWQDLSLTRGLPLRGRIMWQDHDVCGLLTTGSRSIALPACPGAHSPRNHRHTPRGEDTGCTFRLEITGLIHVVKIQAAHFTSVALSQTAFFEITCAYYWKIWNHLFPFVTDCVYYNNNNLFYPYTGHTNYHPPPPSLWRSCHQSQTDFLYGTPWSTDEADI